MQGRLDDVRKLYPIRNFYPGRVQSPQKMWEKRKKDSGKRLLFVIGRVVGSNDGWRQILPAEFQQETNWSRKDFAIKRMVSTSERLVQCTD